MIIHFKNVGRNKRSWDAECKELDYDWFYSQVKRNAIVMSTDLDFLLNDTETGGTICAGFHDIGTFEIEEGV